MKKNTRKIVRAAAKKKAALLDRYRPYGAPNHWLYTDARRKEADFLRSLRRSTRFSNYGVFGK